MNKKLKKVLNYWIGNKNKRLAGFFYKRNVLGSNPTGPYGSKLVFFLSRYSLSIPCFIKWPPVVSFYLCSVFSNKHYTFYYTIMWKNVHQVSGAGIRTHNLLNVSLLSWPLDQGFRPCQSLVTPRTVGNTTEGVCMEVSIPTNL